MNSQLRIVMHPDDEAHVINELLSDSSVVLINGPRWPQARPTVTRDISHIGHYCIIWCPKDLPELASEFMPKQNDWYCRSESATIQFLRCAVHGNVICEGRIAASSNLEGVDRRLKKLRRLIKKKFVNSIVRWQSPDLLNEPTSPNGTANPSKPDNSLWVGPIAMEWLQSDKRRRIKQFLSSTVKGTV